MVVSEPFRPLGRASVMLFFWWALAPSLVLAQPFSYEPPGALISGSGTGRVDATVYVPGMRFPIENSPAYANSQVWGVGGVSGPSGSQCDARNYSYPWHDNFCESRRWTMPLCPAGVGHQGQDIRPATCENRVHWTVAAESGTITSVGSYSVYLQADSGVRHRYLHMDHARLAVSVRQRVTKGQRLGLVSNNMGGTPTTIHLHYDLYSGGRYIPTYMSLVQSYEALVGQARAGRAAVSDGVDLDGNGLDDVFWYGPASDPDYIWYSQGHNRFSSVRSNVVGTYVPIGGDFNGDGRGDVFWYAAGPAQDGIWFSNGAGFDYSRRAISGTYSPIGGDFNGDGRTDIFWYGPGADPDYIWYSDAGEGATFRSDVTGTYRPIAGDFDGDGLDDIFWYAAGSASDWIWYSTGDGFRAQATAVSGTYDPISGDFNGDGYTDIFWYGAASNPDYLWITTGPGVFQSVRKTVTGTYRPVQGDFNGDGLDDIFFYGPGSGIDRLWFGTGSSRFASEAVTVTGTYLPIP